MTRDIKFRVWDGKKIYDGNSIVAIRQSTEVTPTVASTFKLNGFFLELGRAGYVFMQFTGLKDKNGKEIYEGDVVAHDARKIYQAGLWKSEVYFEGGSFQVKVDMAAHLDSDFHIGTIKKNLGLWNMEYIEVIGNIYENPELLQNIS